MSKQINFNLDFKEFKETERLGEFEGILVNYEHKKLGHGYYKFVKGSMKQNEGKTMKPDRMVLKGANEMLLLDYKT